MGRIRAPAPAPAPAAQPMGPMMFPQGPVFYGRPESGGGQGLGVGNPALGSWNNTGNGMQEWGWNSSAGIRPGIAYGRPAPPSQPRQPITDPRTGQTVGWQGQGMGLGSGTGFTPLGNPASHPAPPAAVSPAPQFGNTVDSIRQKLGAAGLQMPASFSPYGPTPMPRPQMPQTPAPPQQTQSQPSGGYQYGRNPNLM